MAKYLKLGAKAQTFFDPSTDVSISNKQILRVKDVALGKPAIAQGLASRHLEEATEAEWEEYTQNRATSEADAQKKHDEHMLRKSGIPQLLAASMAANAATLKADGAKMLPADDEQDVPETKSELIDYLKESPFVIDEQKKTLTKLSLPELKAIYDQVKPK